MNRSRITTLMVVAALGTPAVVSAQQSACPSAPVLTALASPLAVPAPVLPSVLVCVNGTAYTPAEIIVRGKLALLPTTTIDLGGGASFTVSAAFNSDPFVNFTFGSVVPNGFGPLAFDVYFTTPVIGGPYNEASSSGTLGVTAVGGNGATGTVSPGLYSSYISGYGNLTNLGVDTGNGVCTVSSPPNPNSTSCNPANASSSFAPTTPLLLSARLSYTHNTTVGGSSTVGWTGAVTLDATAVPEPATIALVMSGLLVIGGVGLRRNRAS